MDVRRALTEAGFHRVIALDGAPWGGGTLLLAIWFYEAEAHPARTEAWVDPYYYVSQQAHVGATQVVQAAQEAGMKLELRPDIRLKPIFARLPGFSQGRNTLSCLEGVGSRFHVKNILMEEKLPPDFAPEEEDHPLHCGDCRACMAACPTGAIDEEGFHRERCLRNWMMSGQPVPEALRPFMGNRLMGCDACQRCCPHNPAPAGETLPPVPLRPFLEDAKAACAPLRDSMGVNMAIPNRVLGQACLIAGCSGDESLLPLLTDLAAHPSPTVAEHAAWAARQISAAGNRGCRMDENTI